MTLQELSQYFKLRERLARDEEILKSLQEAVSPSVQNLTGMPHASGVSDKVGNLAVEIADMEERVRYLREEVGRSGEVITELIDTIQDEQLRTIFRLRFLRCLTWGEVAAVIGGRNTEHSVKSACYRYLSPKNLQRRDAP